jgi:hypothetical protein
MFYSLSSSAAGYSESYAKEQDNSTTGVHHWLHRFDNENSSKFPELLKLQCLNIDAILFNDKTLDHKYLTFMFSYVTNH